MELDERKRRILKIIADLYTKTGEPVGSKVVALYLDSAYSPATIRNDMAALFELGLLEQPHTSAGRVPSHLGYRVFVDELMTVKPLSGRLRDNIEAMFNVRDPDPDKLLRDAASALSQITRCAAFTTTRTPKTVTVRKVEIVPSAMEAFGRVTVEAMLSGNPVLASDAGANRELIEENKTGWFFEEGDAESLAEKMKDIIKHPEMLSQMGHAAYAAAKESYLSDRNTKEIEQLYYEALDEKRKGSP